MVSQTVSESRDGLISCLIYAAGAVAGLTSGLLEVSARLLLAGLHEKYSTWLTFRSVHERLAAGSPASTTAPLASSPEAPATPEAEDPAPHTLTDTLGSSSDTKSLSSVPPADSSCAGVGVGATAETCPTEITASNAGDRQSYPHASREHGATQTRAIIAMDMAPAQNPIDAAATTADAPIISNVQSHEVADAHCRSAAANCNDPDDGRHVALASKHAAPALSEGESDTPAACSEARAPTYPDADETSAELLVDSFVTPDSCCDGLSSWESPSEGDASSRTAAVGLATVQDLEPVAEVTLQSDKLSNVIAAVQGLYEARCASGIMPMAYGSADSVDSAKDVPMPKATKAPVAAPSTAGLSSSQRSETKRKSKNRKGTHTTKTR